MNTTYLKYSGSKSKILERVLGVIHNGKPIPHYIEPFVGTCIVAANVVADKYSLSDLNRDLILTHKETCYPARLNIELERLFGEHYDIYYQIRDDFNAMRNGTVKMESALYAAMFIYLNKHGFNGLIRYSQKSGFNVPKGKSKSLPSIPNIGDIGTFLNQPNVELNHQDFADVMLNAPAGATIYCDPPYVPFLTSQGGFSYTEGGFKHKDQVRLAELAELCHHKGCRVIISNHDNEITRQLYRNATRIKSFDVMRTINCIGTGRKPVRELFAIYE